MPGVAYSLPIAVSLFLLTLSVSDFKRTLWHCGQLLQYMGMGSLGMRVHRGGNAMGDTAKTSTCVSSTSAHNAILSLLMIPIIPCRQI